MKDDALPGSTRQKPLTEGEVARLLRSALDVEVPDLSAGRIAQLARMARLRARQEHVVPVWAVLGFIVLLVTLAARGLGMPARLDWTRDLALAVPAANLLVAPVAAYAIVRNRRVRHEA